MENKKESGQQGADWRTNAVHRDGHTSLGYQRSSTDFNRQSRGQNEPHSLSAAVTAARYQMTIDPTFTQRQKLEASDAEVLNLFGNSVAISGETVVVGAPFDDGAAGIDQGSAYVFGPVPFNFSGFFPPVDNPPAVNVGTAGRAIPVKFSLSGDQGLNIFAAGFPVSQRIACDDGAPESEIEQTVTAGGSSLSYDAESDTYTYVWKTDDSWAGTCRQLVVRLKDGSERVAFFRFR